MAACARFVARAKVVLNSFLAGAALLGLLACGRLAAPGDASGTKITNGIAANGEFPAVVMLHFKANGGDSICTATFVNDAQVLTAAHCVFNMVSDPRQVANLLLDGRTLGRGDQIRALAVAVNPAYTPNSGLLNSNDLAVVTFPPATAAAAVGLYSGEPEVGQAFTIVGFGLNDYQTEPGSTQLGTGSGVKRKGTNVIQSVENGMIRFTGVPTATAPGVPLGENVASGSGDSGGPMFIDQRLAAVTSGGSLKSIQDPSGHTSMVKVSNYVDLNTAANQGFLAGALQGGL